MQRIRRFETSHAPLQGRIDHPIVNCNDLMSTQERFIACGKGMVTLPQRSGENLKPRQCGDAEQRIDLRGNAQVQWQEEVRMPFDQIDGDAGIQVDFVYHINRPKRCGWRQSRAP